MCRSVKFSVIVNKYEASMVLMMALFTHSRYIRNRCEGTVGVKEQFRHTSRDNSMCFTFGQPPRQEIKMAADNTVSICCLDILCSHTAGNDRGFATYFSIFF